MVRWIWELYSPANRPTMTAYRYGFASRPSRTFADWRHREQAIPDESQRRSNRASETNPMCRTALYASISAGCLALIAVGPASAQSTGGGVRPSSGFNGMFGSGSFTNSGGNTGLSSTMSNSSGSSFGSSSSQSGQSTGGIQRSEITTGGPQGIQSQNFIGNSAATATNVRSMQGTAAGSRTGLAGRDGQNSLAGLQGLFSQMGGPNGFNQNGQQGQARMPLSIPIRLGFPSRPFVGTQFTGRFENRLAKLPALKALGPIEVAMEGRTAILTGTVASEADRQLAEGVARLEPEVADVQNNLVVDSSAATPDEAAAPPRER